MAMNVLQALENAFGDSAKMLDTSAASAWLDMEVKPLKLVLSQDSRVFVRCSGQVIATLTTVSKGTPMRFYVTLDDSEGNTWDYERAQMNKAIAEGRKDTIDWGKYHTSRPNQKLRLVASN
jgi:hypothetical protein